MKKKHTVRKVLLGILIALLVITPTYIFVSGYLESRPKLQYTFNETAAKAAAYPDTKFAVISDVHYYDTSLGTTGAAFEKVLRSDRKLLKESAELLNLAIDNIIKSGVKFVLISGDLTKDGEQVNHEKVSAALSRLTDKEINVYVIPGNHDVNNPDAVRFEGDKEFPVPSISEEQFANIYKNMGYGKAVYRDENSLSYVAEPVNNLWIIAVDSTRSDENKPGQNEIVGGKLTQSQEKWLEAMLKKAKENNKSVIFMEHHGVVEHWKGQSKLHPDYLISDYKYLGELLASYNVKLAFSGHYHAQDITLGDYGKNGSIYDIETGSLSTAPCMVRIGEIKGNKVNFTAMDMVTKYKPGTDFAKGASEFVAETVKIEAYNTLRKYKVSEKDSNYIADSVASAFLAHYNGDEDETKKPILDTGKLSLWGKFIYSQERYVLNGLWKDLPPADNNVVLDLN